jgi:hypothetical protein
MLPTGRRTLHSRLSFHLSVLSPLDCTIWPLLPPPSRKCLGLNIPLCLLVSYMASREHLRSTANLNSGMNVAAGPELAAAVTNAGGLGVIGGHGYTPKVLKQQVCRLGYLLKFGS